MTSIVPASFNVTVGATLQSFLNQAQGTTTDTSLFGVLKNGSVGGGTNSILGALQSNGNGTSAASATATALGSGGIKKTYHSVLQAIGADPGGTLTEHWNTNGTEPSTLVTLRSYGWIKLTAKQFDPAAKTSVGSYQFTPVGYAQRVLRPRKRRRSHRRWPRSASTAARSRRLQAIRRRVRRGPVPSSIWWREPDQLRGPSISS